MNCALPYQERNIITLAHGGGGRVFHQLLAGEISSRFPKGSGHDAATFPTSGNWAMTTDSYVITPRIFPGGDIGKLAVCGSVNDLAMGGAKAKYLTLGLIIEEGLPMDELRIILDSIASTCARADVDIITGDTKVVDRGRGDGLYINTTAVGEVLSHHFVHPNQVKPGDVVIVSGDVGRHGAAVMASRQSLQFDSEITSDCGLLHETALELCQSLEVHCMRDLTRGGLASALIEVAQESGTGTSISEELIPVTEHVASFCDILGLDPVYVANEGRFAVWLPASEVDQALKIMHHHEISSGACVIGDVRQTTAYPVTMVTPYGTHRPLDMMSGEQLPRIC